MTRAFAYIVAENSNPDKLQDCTVPYLVNKEIIFFGPCKKRLRQLLSDMANSKFTEDHYLIGLNASNGKKERKIIWVGKIKMALTFYQAWNEVKDNPAFRGMIDNDYSPIHIRPIVQNGELKGYKHVSKMHGEDGKWILDLISSTKDNRIEIAEDSASIRVRDGFNSSCVLNRDCCFILENIFFAQIGGIEIDSDILKIFQDSQKERKDIDKYALFGRQSNGNADGKIGGWLELKDNLAKKLINLIESRAKKLGQGDSINSAGVKRGGC